MGLFSFLKKDENKKLHKGFHELTVSAVERLTRDTVRVSFEVPASLSSNFNFLPGQYLTLILPLNGKEERRSYSICSLPGETLSIAVKAIANGTVSKWLNNELRAGNNLMVSEPTGNFVLENDQKKVVAVAAGSGITPIMAIAGALGRSHGALELFYGNKTTDTIIFREELSKLSHVKVHHYLSQEEMEGYHHGRIDKDSFTKAIKADLDLLKADAFFLCGPEQMIIDIRDTLKFFGVNEKKIRYELFTTPTAMASSEKQATPEFHGDSRVKVILHGELAEFTLNSRGKTLLEAIEKEGMDAPYSCKGGVCCSCRAKVLKGSAIMDMNYSLTDQEVEKGYILTCQGHPNSEELMISFDE